MDTLLSKHWHHLPQVEIATLLESVRTKGLDTFEVARRQTRFGPNRLTLKKDIPSPGFISAAVSSAAYLYSVGRHGRHLCTTRMGRQWSHLRCRAGQCGDRLHPGIQGNKGHRSIGAIHGGCGDGRKGRRKRKIAAFDLVPGDIVLLQSGEKMPADLRLLRSREMQVDESTMTGDGVNDAPALKQADIGIAMGVGGIEAAVEEGWAVFDNLFRFITWTLPTNIGEGMVILVVVFAGISLPITPVLILWINMTTAVLLGLMLAFEGNVPRIIERPPRRPEVPVLTRGLGFRIGLVSLLLLLGAFGLFEWAWVLTGGLVIYSVVGTEKWLRRRADGEKGN